MSNYFLFLDESKPNHIYKHFCLGGCIIKQEDYYNHIIPNIEVIKQNVFGNTSVILHEVDIRNAQNGQYRILKNKKKREEFWNLMNLFFKNNQFISTVCVSINTHEYGRIYNSPYRNDEYLIALQVVLENFVHFLEIKNGTGSIYVESRNPTDDTKLGNHYHLIKANGTLFFDKNVFQRRLNTISFPLKTDNNVGLQIADFIPNPITRFCSGMNQRNYSLYDVITAKFYDGGVGLTDRFGLKQIP